MLANAPDLVLCIGYIMYTQGCALDTESGKWIGKGRYTQWPLIIIQILLFPTIQKYAGSRDCVIDDYICYTVHIFSGNNHSEPCNFLMISIIFA